MDFRKILCGVVAVGLAGGALADDEKKMKMEIAVVGDNGGGEKHFRINSDDLGFDLHDMQEGESRSIVDETGQNILITRTSDGYSFNIDGEKIDMPHFAGNGRHVRHEVDTGPMHDMSETTIISAKPIDAATQQAIMDLLGSAGYDSEVSFIDRDAAHGGKVMIRKIEKVVESPQT